MILNKMETFADKVKSFKDIKKELKAFFSINGYSEALGTNSLFKKVFWFIAFFALFASCMYVVDRNVKGFQANDVVTQFRVIDDQNMNFPAVTFCVAEFNLVNFYKSNWTFKNIFSKLLDCKFESQPCNESSYFKHTQLNYNGKNYDCYSFNSGRKGLLSSKGVGSESGLEIIFNLSNTDKVYFAVHDNNGKITSNELNDIAEQDDGKIILIEMKKTIETKEQMPYSNCTQNIYSDTSHLVKEILQQNITYRQRHCYDICLKEYMGNYSDSQNLSIQEAYFRSDFDYKGNCSNLCLLECTSTKFDIIRNEMNLNLNDPKFLRLNFYYSDRKYTEITQSVKVTLADFISNTGGVLGLFLELSFFSIYRCFISVFDFIFI